MNNTYIVGKQGGRAIITMPVYTIGDLYTRTVWKDGSIVYKPVKEDSEHEQEVTA